MMASSSPPELDAEIEAGIRSAREGRVVSLEEADARLRATIAAGQARALPDSLLLGLSDAYIDALSGDVRSAVRTRRARVTSTR